MGTGIIVECLAKEVGMEVISIEVIFSETLNITDKCRVRQALRSNESRLQVEDEMVNMCNGSFSFFLKPIGLGAYGLMNFFADGGEAFICFSKGNLQFSKIGTAYAENLSEVTYAVR